jgi:hypothetical protein
MASCSNHKDELQAVIGYNKEETGQKKILCGYIFLQHTSIEDTEACEVLDRLGCVLLYSYGEHLDEISAAMHV